MNVLKLMTYTFFGKYMHAISNLDPLLTNQIADFGVSEEIERTETNLSRWAGTPAFVAPECLDGEYIHVVVSCVHSCY